MTYLGLTEGEPLVSTELRVRSRASHGGDCGVMHVDRMFNDMSPESDRRPALRSHRGGNLVDDSNAALSDGVEVVVVRRTH